MAMYSSATYGGIAATAGASNNASPEVKTRTGSSGERVMITVYKMGRVESSTRRSAALHLATLGAAPRGGDPRDNPRAANKRSGYSMTHPGGAERTILP